MGVGQPTLIRFYTLHVIGLPLVGAMLMAVHFWRIRKDGGEAGPPPPSRRELEQARAEQQSRTGIAELVQRVRSPRRLVAERGSGDMPKESR